jgi:hypothetical protein
MGLKNTFKRCPPACWGELHSTLNHGGIPMKHSWLILAGLVIFLGSSNAGYAEQVEEDLETITLPTPLHFLSPAEEDVTVPPGTYAITMGEDGMQLDSTTGFQSYLIDSKPNTHTEELPVPGALLIPGENDLQYLTVLFPWGESFEAVGSTSGIIPRGDIKIPTKAFRKFFGKLRQRMAAAQKKTTGDGNGRGLH